MTKDFSDRVTNLSPQKRRLLELRLQEQQRARAGAPRPRIPPGSPLVPLKPAGSKPPLFCIHPILGQVFPYYALAGFMASDQPVYGLQAPGLDGQRPPIGRIEPMAEEYIRAIQVIQPNGPYLLSGWSFGSLVAFEMALQLQRAGQTVGFVGLLDTPAPVAGRSPSRLADLAFMLTTGLRGTMPYIRDQRALVAALQPSAATTSGRFKALFGWLNKDARPHALIERAVIATLTSPEAAVLASQPTIRRQMQVLQVHTEARSCYQPERYPGHVSLFLTSSRKPSADPTHGWKRLAAAGVTIHRVPGDHMSMLRMPHVETLAAEMMADLGKVQQHAATASAAASPSQVPP